MKSPPVRIATFVARGVEHYGVVTEQGIVDLMPEFGKRYGNLREIVAADMLSDLTEAAKGESPTFGCDETTYQIPIGNPEKIICVGVNYPDRNAEYRDDQAAPARPSIFVRFARSFVGHGQNLVRPPESVQLDYEGEIAIIIGKSGRRIPREQAHDHIAALTLCNEGTVRDWVRHGKFNVTPGKNWDASGAIGPWIVPFENASQLDNVELVTRVNGEVRQRDHTSRMIFDFSYLVNYVSTFCTLVPGDLIVCGTPTGAGARLDPPVWLKPGDVVEVEADGIGVLRNGIGDEKC